jgi:hypothetical protein
MSRAMSPWTGDSHEVSGQFTGDHHDFLMGGVAKDTCEDEMRHLCPNAFGRNGIRSHCLGGTGRRSAKGRRLVGSNDNTDDANEKSTGCSIPVLSMCCDEGNRHAADNGNGAFNCRLGCKFEADFHMGMR